MEVTHKDDHVTHAVVGGTEKIDMQVNADDGFMMQMLSASLYSDQRMAVAREVLCNADDAHKAAGVTKPFHVTLTSEKFIIRDFGLGIAHADIGPIYGTYGKSTKRNSLNETGGFGLGCKSPFAYTDNFQVTSMHNGVKTVYRMSKSDSEVNGKPSITKILSVPTTETGLEVSINIASPRDSRSFAERVKKVLANGEMNAILNGVQAPVLPFSLMENGYMITTEQPLLEEHTLLVRYGAVIYPIPTHETYRNQYVAAERKVSSIGKDTTGYHSRGDFCLVLQAQPGSLSLTPSREALTITEKTIETVTKLLEDFLKNVQVSTERDTRNIYFGALAEAKAQKDTDTILSLPRDLKLVKKFVPEPINEDGKYYITNSDTLSRWDLHGQYPGKHDPAFYYKDFMDRLGWLIQSGESPLDRGLLRGLYKAMKTTKGNFGRNAARNSASLKFFRRSIVFPVLAHLREAKFFDKQEMRVVYPRLNWTDCSDHWGSNRMYAGRVCHWQPESHYNLLFMMKRVIVLTHDSEKAMDHIQNRHTMSDFPAFKENGGARGVLLVTVGRAKHKLDEARALLKTLKGYTIIDFTEKLEYRVPKSRDPLSKKKLPGYATLQGVYEPAVYSQLTGKLDVEGYLNWNSITTTNRRVEKPEAYAVLFGQKSDKRYKFVGAKDRNMADQVRHMYGDRIAAVINAGAIDSLDKAKVPSVNNWLPQQIAKDLAADKELLAALPGSRHVFDAWIAKQDVDVSFVTMLFTHPVVREMLKLPELKRLSESQAALISLLDTCRNEYSELRSSDIVQKIDTMEPSKAIVKFVEKLKANKLLSVLDISEVRDLASSPDEELKAKVIKLIKTVIKG